MQNQLDHATIHLQKASEFLSSMIGKCQEIESAIGESLSIIESPIRYLASIITIYFPEIETKDIMEFNSRTMYNKITTPKYLLIFLGFKYFESDFKNIDISRQTKSRAINSIKSLMPNYKPHKEIIEKTQQIESVLKSRLKYLENNEITKEISNLFLEFNHGYQAKSIKMVFENDKKIIYNMHVIKQP